MPLLPSPPSAVVCRSFYSLIFGKNLEILLENTGSIDLKNLKAFLQSDKKGILYLNKNIRFDLENKEIHVRGYELNSYEGWTVLSSKISDTTHKIPIDFDQKILITTLEYFYHMMSTI